MVTAAIIIASVALIVATVAIIMAAKKQKVVKETTVEVVKESAQADNPFTYDKKGKVYRLNGSLKVEGSISCINKEE